MDESFSLCSRHLLPWLASAPERVGQVHLGLWFAQGQQTAGGRDQHSPDHIGITRPLHFGSSWDDLLCCGPVRPGAVSVQDQTRACWEEPTPLRPIPRCPTRDGAKLPLAAQVQPRFPMLRPSPAPDPGSGHAPAEKMRNML